MTARDPSFTVIVPTRDRSGLLAEALASMDAQTPQGSAAVRLPLSGGRESARDQAAHG